MKPVIVTLSYGELTKLIEKNKQRYLNITEQAAQGWLPNKMVGAIIQQLRKGLDQ